jgi:1A family penicillin-binding protein
MGWFVYDVMTDLPERSALREMGNMARATTFYDRNDEPVFTIFKEHRLEVPLSAISDKLVRAVVAVEDQRFFDHKGLDGVRIVAAALVNLRQGRRAQGGSTITQQLARQSFLTLEKTLRRKLKEMVLAIQIESAYDKQQILELYLNKVYFGDGLYGAEAASRGFFGKTAAELSVAEAALIAGLVQSPSTNAPTVNLERAISRRNVVLQAMHSAGAISADELERARAEEVVLQDGLRRQEPFGLHFKEQVRRELVERFGTELVYTGGLRVYTTMDIELQLAAEEKVEESLQRIEKEPRSSRRSDDGGEPTEDAGERLEAALVAIDPLTGHVVAMVGGRSFAESRFNRAVQARRQPGSAFKPLLFAAALEAGFTPATVIDQLDKPIATPQGPWIPEDGHSTVTAMTLRAALRVSSNRAAARLLEDLGVERTVEYVRNVGIGTLPSVPSLALGSGEVTPISLAAAYLPFANQGVSVRPTVIRRVEDAEGNLLYSSESAPRTVMSEATAFLMAQMLSDVVNRGTGNRVRQLGFRLPAGGKTGTTNDFHDVWFVGFTPRLLTAVWLGFDQPKTIRPGGYAGDLAVPLWTEFMKVATAGEKPVAFPRPRDVVGVEVCSISGKRPSLGCSEVAELSPSGTWLVRSLVTNEFFARGTEPREICTLHPMHGPLERRLAGLDAPEGEVPLPPAGSMPRLVEDRGAAVAGTPSSDAPAIQQGEEQQRRGFWSRVFGRRPKPREEPPKNEKDRKEQPPQRQHR